MTDEYHLEIYLVFSYPKHHIFDYSLYQYLSLDIFFCTFIIYVWICQLPPSFHIVSFPKKFSQKKVIWHCLDSFVLLGVLAEKKCASNIIVLVLFQFSGGPCCHAPRRQWWRPVMLITTCRHSCGHAHHALSDGVQDKPGHPQCECPQFWPAHPQLESRVSDDQHMRDSSRRLLYHCYRLCYCYPLHSSFCWSLRKKIEFSHLNFDASVCEAVIIIVIHDNYVDKINKYLAIIIIFRQVLLRFSVNMSMFMVYAVK